MQSRRSYTHNATRFHRRASDKALYDSRPESAESYVPVPVLAGLPIASDTYTPPSNPAPAYESGGGDFGGGGASSSFDSGSSSPDSGGSSGE